VTVPAQGQHEQLRPTHSTLVYHVTVETGVRKGADLSVTLQQTFIITPCRAKPHHC
jgi:hypothetical protein